MTAIVIKIFIQFLKHFGEFAEPHAFGRALDERHVERERDAARRAFSQRSGECWRGVLEQREREQGADLLKPMRDVGGRLCRITRFGGRRGHGRVVAVARGEERRRALVRRGAFQIVQPFVQLWRSRKGEGENEDQERAREDDCASEVVPGATNPHAPAIVGGSDAIGKRTIFSRNSPNETWQLDSASLLV